MPAEFREFMGIEARCQLDGFFDGIHDNVETVGARARDAVRRSG